MAQLLLLDADPVLLRAQRRRAFPSPDHTVRIASTGAEGLAQVRSQAPDVILLDLRLPDGSGLEVCEAVRALDARIPIIFVTMAKSAETAIEAMKMGAFN